MNKRTYEATTSSSASTISKFGDKIRRRSFFVQWNKAIEVPPRLKKLEKHRLSLSPNEFIELEYQLYTTNIISSKKSKQYIYAANKVDLNKGKKKHEINNMYVKLIRYINVFDLFRLCIWIHFNKTMSIPPVKLRHFFSRKTPDIVQDTTLATKTTTIKINDVYTLYHAQWNSLQRQAARHTRDRFLRGFGLKYPMLWDLRWSESNCNMMKDFIQALLKAHVDSRIIANICCICMYQDITIFEKEESNEESKEEETILEKEMTSKEDDTHLERIRETTIAQRTSITNFNPLERDISAAIVLQRWYRKRYNQMKNAVLIIERSWLKCPYKIQTDIYLLDVHSDREQMVEALDRINNQEDLFKYDEFTEEIKNDYKFLENEPRDNKYWLAVLAIFIVPVIGSIIIYEWLETRFYGFLWVFYFAAQFLTMWRVDTKTLWNQTMILTLISCVLLNIHGVQWSASRFIGCTAIIAIGRKKWLYGFFLLLVFRGAWSWMMEETVKVGSFIVFTFYDLYLCGTMRGASRQGKAITMVHKVQINIIFIVIASLIAAFTGCYSCLNH